MRQTSKHESGQIYLPVVNTLLFLGVLAVMLTFGSSAALATAYGVSVTGALVVDTVLLLVVAPVLWGSRPWQEVLAAIAFGGSSSPSCRATSPRSCTGAGSPSFSRQSSSSSWRRGVAVGSSSPTTGG
ncbi:hypothetical protein GCM10025866_15360 [Naasia aerilata]|uniref:K+ potassium transporter integral membrane domain-containing protein n=1 Tax=Naasia aerilata TaxID=1162966 RepID=A0ABN6XL21_9MICO|nr:hypothetical protein GCM10025866_15360 [Naasia aerilata]